MWPLFLIFLACKAAQPLTPEARLDDLELAVTTLQKENADLERMIDQVDDQHSRCLLCQDSCNEAKKVMVELQGSLESLNQ